MAFRFSGHTFPPCRLVRICHTYQNAVCCQTTTSKQFSTLANIMFARQSVARSSKSFAFSRVAPNNFMTQRKQLAARSLKRQSKHPQHSMAWFCDKDCGCRLRICEWFVAGVLQISFTAPGSLQMHQVLLAALCTPHSLCRM